MFTHQRSRCGVRSSTRRIAAQIQRYCSAHPHARDTLEGIAWWVQMQVQEEIRTGVADAVRILVEQGTLERHRLQDGSEVFGCCARRPDDTRTDQHQ
jgi:hypothetical protein